jgi:hypothetical protein
MYTVLCWLAGEYCPQVTHLKVYERWGYRGPPLLPLLLLCMTAQLQALTLHGLQFFSGRFSPSGDCQASQLVQQLLKHCANLRVLDLQVSYSTAAQEV